MNNISYHILGNHIGITQSTYAVIFGNKTLNTFDCKSGVSSQIVNWFVFGWQQWGYTHKSSSGTHANTTINYPISFSSPCYAVASTREGSSADSTWNAVIDSLTTSSFRCQLKIGIYWIAVGKQQWGIWNTKRSSALMECAFPVSNPKETLAIFAVYFDNSDVSNGAILVKNTTLSSCVLKLWSSTQVCFMILGV